MPSSKRICSAPSDVRGWRKRGKSSPIACASSAADWRRDQSCARRDRHFAEGARAAARQCPRRARSSPNSRHHRCRPAQPPRVNFAICALIVPQIASASISKQPLRQQKAALHASTTALPPPLRAAMTRHLALVSGIDQRGRSRADIRLQRSGLCSLCVKACNLATLRNSCRL